MDLRAKTDDCLILRGRDYNETDRLLVVFSKSYGKLSCLARGVRRANSRLKASTQPFSYVKLTFAAPRGGLTLITQGQPQQVYPELRDDLTKIACAAYIGEMLDAVLPEGKPQEDIFVLAAAMLALLAAVDEPFLVLACFRVRLLAALGYRLNFGGCAACGGEFPAYLISAERGGLFCPDCAARLTPAYWQGQKLPRLSAGAARLLGGLAEWDFRRIFNLKISPPMRREIDAALNAYLSFFIGRPAEKAAANLSVYYTV